MPYAGAEYDLDKEENHELIPGFSEMDYYSQNFYRGPVLDQIQSRVPFYRQDTLVWCWVASAKMVVEALAEKTPSQCDMLQEVYGA